MKTMFELPLLTTLLHSSVNNYRRPITVTLPESTSSYSTMYVPIYQNPYFFPVIVFAIPKSSN